MQQMQRKEKEIKQYLGESNMLSSFVQRNKYKELPFVPSKFVEKHIIVNDEMYYWNSGRNMYHRFPRVTSYEKQKNMKKAQQRNFRLLRLRGARVNILAVTREMGINPPNYLTGFFDTLEKIILQEPRMRS